MISNTENMNTSIKYNGKALTTLQKENKATWKKSTLATLDAINSTFRDVDAIWDACREKLSSDYSDKKTFAAAFCGKPGLSPSTAAKYLRVSRGVNVNPVDTKTGKRSPVKPELHGRKFTQTDLNAFQKDVQAVKDGGDTPTIFFAVAELGRWDDANRTVGVKPKPQKVVAGTDASSEEQSKTHGASLVSITHNGAGTLKETTQGEIQVSDKNNLYKICMHAVGTMDKALKGNDRALFRAELVKRFEAEILVEVTA
jgi:hypothetical protein